MLIRGLLLRSALVLSAVLASAVMLLPSASAATEAAPASEASVTSDDLVTIYRFYFPGFDDPGRESDHATHTAAPPSGLYTLEGPTGKLSVTHRAGTTPMYECNFFGKHRTYVDNFSSTDPQCEGYSNDGVIGYIFTSPPAGFATVPLYRCRVAANQELFDSRQSNCEGQIVDAILGWIV